MLPTLTKSMVWLTNATGRFTSQGTSFFTTKMYRETIIGSGTFVVDTSDESLVHMVLSTVLVRSKEWSL